MTEHFQIAVIGSGPGGLGAATNAAHHGVSHILFEKREVANTIFDYQLRKHVMAEPSKLPLRTRVPFEAGTRETILERWSNSLEELGVNLRKAEITAIQRDGDRFTVRYGDGAVTADQVILAIGEQGTPRRPGVPGEDLEHVSYTLSDPDAFEDRDILVVGVGDAAIENALALAGKNRVSILNREDGFPRAKVANAAALTRAIQDGTIRHLQWSTLNRIESGITYVDGPDGEIAVQASEVIIRIGAILPRRFIEECGVEFPSKDPNAVPAVSHRYESNVSGLYIVGALIGYQLIKQAMNQGHEAVEHILGNEVVPADQVLIEETLCDLPGDVNEHLAEIRAAVPLFSDLSDSQFRELMIDSTVHQPGVGDPLFLRNDYTDTFFSTVRGSAEIELPDGGSVPIGTGEYFGEMGLLSGRRRTATVRAAESNSLFLETPRNQMLKLISSVGSVKEQLDQKFMRNALTSSIFPDIEPEFLDRLVSCAEMRSYKKGEVLAAEGELGEELFVIRKGSVKLSRRNKKGVDVTFTYLPAGHYVGEMALLSEKPQPRTATVTAAVPVETIVVRKADFRDLLADNPTVRQKITKLAEERRIENITDTQDEYTGEMLDFVVGEGITDAENVLLIDSDLCVGCDNCEAACAATHNGYSRLDRKGGKSFTAIQVPISCRHCENPLCMLDCPPDALVRLPDGEVIIQDSCIGCGNCVNNCPYGVIQMVYDRPKKSSGWFDWLFGGGGRGDSDTTGDSDAGAAKAGKCDMCRKLPSGPACVRACPTGAAMRVNPTTMLQIIGSKRESSGSPAL